MSAPYLVLSPKRKGEGDDLEFKRQRAEVFQAKVMTKGHEWNVEFSYNQTTAVIALAKLKELSDYFSSFFSGTFQEGAGNTEQVFSLEKPVNEDFSPELWIQMIRKMQTGEPKWESSSLMGITQLISYYQLKGSCKNQILEVISINNIDEVIGNFEYFVQCIDRKTLAIHCLQILVDDPHFVDGCLLHPEFRKFFSDIICLRMDFFNQQQIYVTTLHLDVCPNPSQRVQNQELERQILYLTSETKPKKLIALSRLFLQLENVEIINLSHSNDDWHEILQYQCFDPGESLFGGSVVRAYYARMEDFTDETWIFELKLLKACMSFFFGHESSIKNLMIRAGEHSRQSEVYLPHIIRRIKNENGDFIVEFTAREDLLFVFQLPTHRKENSSFSKHVGEGGYATVGYNLDVDEESERSKEMFLKAIPFPIPAELKDIEPSRLPWKDNGILDPKLKFK